MPWKTDTRSHTPHMNKDDQRSPPGARGAGGAGERTGQVGVGGPGRKRRVWSGAFLSNAGGVLGAGQGYAVESIGWRGNWDRVKGTKGKGEGDRMCGQGAFGRAGAGHGWDVSALSARPFCRPDNFPIGVRCVRHRGPDSPAPRPPAHTTRITFFVGCPLNRIS